MRLRSCTILVLALAVLVGGVVGTSNGLVLCVDSDGHLAVEAPHFRHAHSHAQGADHAPHDRDSDADHGDLHRLVNCSDSMVSVQMLEKSSPSITAAEHHVAALVLCVHTCPATGLEPLEVKNGLGAPTFRGGTAHPHLACVYSVVLLV